MTERTKQRLSEAGYDSQRTRRGTWCISWRNPRTGFDTRLWVRKGSNPDYMFVREAYGEPEELCRMIQILGRRHTID